MKVFLAGGESRHWLNFPLINGEEDNAAVSCRRILQEHGQRSQADCMGGGFPDEVNNENLFSKSTYNTEIPRRATNGDYPIRGGMFDEVNNENIHSRHSSMWGG